MKKGGQRRSSKDAPKKSRNDFLGVISDKDLASRIRETAALMNELLTEAEKRSIEVLLSIDACEDFTIDQELEVRLITKRAVVHL